MRHIAQRRPVPHDRPLAQHFKTPSGSLSVPDGTCVSRTQWLVWADGETKFDLQRDSNAREQPRFCGLWEWHGTNEETHLQQDRFNLWARRQFMPYDKFPVFRRTRWDDWYRTCGDN